MGIYIFYKFLNNHYICYFMNNDFNKCHRLYYKTELTYFIFTIQYSCYLWIKVYLPYVKSHFPPHYSTALNCSSDSLFVVFAKSQICLSRLVVEEENIPRFLSTCPTQITPSLFIFFRKEKKALKNFSETIFSLPGNSQSHSSSQCCEGCISQVGCYPFLSS